MDASHREPMEVDGVEGDMLPEFSVSEKTLAAEFCTYWRLSRVLLDLRRDFGAIVQLECNESMDKHLCNRIQQ